MEQIDNGTESNLKPTEFVSKKDVMHFILSVLYSIVDNNTINSQSYNNTVFSQIMSMYNDTDKSDFEPRDYNLLFVCHNDRSKIFLNNVDIDDCYGDIMEPIQLTVNSRENYVTIDITNDNFLPDKFNKSSMIIARFNNILPEYKSLLDQGTWVHLTGIKKLC